MSLISGESSEGFGSPPYETFRFALTESQLSMDTSTVKEFVQKHSSKFRHVEIEYILQSEEERLIKSWCRHFTEFLKILTNESQLISVEFRHLSECFEQIDTRTYASICRKIVCFLGSQHRLKRAEFRICSFRFHEAVQLLRELAENSWETLTQLRLVEFVRYEPMDKEQDSTAAQNLPLLVDLPRLTTLDIDYSLIFVKMVARQSTSIQEGNYCQGLELSKIILHYSNTTIPTDFRGLTSSDWRLLEILYPDLQVEFFIYTTSPSLREMQFLIVQNMPITQLEYLSDNDYKEMDISVLFGYLLACKINDDLVSLVFYSGLIIPGLASTFSAFIQACRKLECLELSVVHPAYGIDRLVQSWLENPPESLEEVSIRIEAIKEEHEYANLMSSARELELRGLNVKVKLYF